MLSLQSEKLQNRVKRRFNGGGGGTWQKLMVLTKPQRLQLWNSKAASFNWACGWWDIEIYRDVKKKVCRGGIHRSSNWRKLSLWPEHKNCLASCWRWKTTDRKSEKEKVILFFRGLLISLMYELKLQFSFIFNVFSLFISDCTDSIFYPGFDTWIEESIHRRDIFWYVNNSIEAC